MIDATYGHVAPDAEEPERVLRAALITVRARSVPKGSGDRETLLGAAMRMSGLEPPRGSQDGADHRPGQVPEAGRVGLDHPLPLARAERVEDEGRVEGVEGSSGRPRDCGTVSVTVERRP